MTTMAEEGGELGRATAAAEGEAAQVGAAVVGHHEPSWEKAVRRVGEVAAVAAALVSWAVRAPSALANVTTVAVSAMMVGGSAMTVAVSATSGSAAVDAASRVVIETRASEASLYRRWTPYEPP
jgi:4-aminobutyrate aminotransferase-like enzyme